MHSHFIRTFSLLHFHTFDHFSNIWWTVQIMNHLIMQPFPASCRTIHFSNYPHNNCTYSEVKLNISSFCIHLYACLRSQLGPTSDAAISMTFCMVVWGFYVASDKYHKVRRCIFNLTQLKILITIIPVNFRAWKKPLTHTQSVAPPTKACECNPLSPHFKWRWIIKNTYS
jgi:hypothetical protein